MSILVPIQPEGDRPPIFAVHVLGVDCELFRPLAARLGTEQPMYGLGQPTTDLDPSGPTDVSAVAAAYASEINRVSPDGPIALAAISLGGVVAYELAQQLTTAGRQVSLLALFDAFGPEATTGGPSIKNRLASRRPRIGRGPATYQTEQVKRFADADVASQAGYRYDPYPGRMLVVKAGDDPLAEMHIENGMGWTSIAVGGIDFDRAPGTHLSMMAEPNVDRVAKSVERALAAAAPAPSQGIDHDTAERLMTSALRIGRLPATVARLAESPLDGAAQRLVDRADRLLTGLAEVARSATEAATDRLNESGHSARSLPVPNRVQHVTGTIRLDGRPERDVGPASKVMETLDFFPIGSGSPAALRSTVRANGHVDYVRRGSATSRLRLQWTDDKVSRTSLGRLTSRLRPTQHDFDMVRLPEWAWAAYWPLRPIRVARDQLRARAPGRRSGTGAAPANLGIFLGTPLGLIGPLLEYAGIEPGRLLIDIGCGDGRVLIEAVTRFNCRARGYETDRGLVDEARAAAEQAGVADRVEILHQDAGEASFADADIVFAFLPPRMVATILPDALAQLDPRSTFLSHEQMAVAMPIEPDDSALIVGLDEDPTNGGITVANLWRGRRPG